MVSFVFLHRYVDGYRCVRGTVGANYLSSVFSQNMQKTFTEYISEKRMEKAKKLLKSTELPTSEIAAQVGYKTPHYFSFVFLKIRRGAVPR